MSEAQYRHAEAALAALFRVGNAGVKTFRARLRNLRKLDVPRLPKVGSGTRIAYSREAVWQVYVALELEAAGLPSGKAAALTLWHWEALLPGLERAAGAGEERYLFLVPHLIGEAGDDPQPSAEAIILAALTFCGAEEVGRRIAKLGRDSRRALVINVGDGLKTLERIFAAGPAAGNGNTIEG